MKYYFIMSYLYTGNKICIVDIPNSKSRFPNKLYRMMHMANYIFHVVDGRCEYLKNRGLEPYQYSPEELTMLTLMATVINATELDK